MSKIVLSSLILVLVAMALCLCYCVFICDKPGGGGEPVVQPEPEPEPEPEQEQEPEPLLEMFLIDKEQTIPFEECSKRGLDNKVIVLESKYCSACKVVVPVLKEIEKELDREFLHFDLSQEDALTEIEKFYIEAQWTPTVIIGCDALIGGYSKEEYKSAVENFLNNQKNEPSK